MSRTKSPFPRKSTKTRKNLWPQQNFVSFLLLLGMVMVGTASYFLLTHFLFPRVQILESHIITIIVDSLVATVIAFFVIRKIHGLSEDKRIEQRRAAETEKVAHTYARSLIEASMDPLFTISAHGRIQDVNAATELITGHSRRELIGTDFSGYFTEPQRARKVYEKILERGSIRDFELTIRHRDGHLTPVLYNASAYMDEESQVRGVFAAARDMTLYKEAQKEIDRQHEQLRDLTYRLGEVEESERRELAKELHDKVGQNLTALGISLNILKAQLAENSPEPFISRIGDCLEMVSETTARIRDVMVELRPSVLDDYGLFSALRWYGAQFSLRTGIEVVVEGDESMMRPGISTENAFFRIAQEALTNVAKHADASRVTIKLDTEKGYCHMVISDNGKGFIQNKTLQDENGRSWGLLVMHERALRAGGSLQIQSDIGKGTKVVVEVGQ